MADRSGFGPNSVPWGGGGAAEQEEIFSSSYAAAAYLEHIKFPQDKKVRAGRLGGWLQGRAEGVFVGGLQPAVHTLAPGPINRPSLLLPLPAATGVRGG